MKFTYAHPAADHGSTLAHIAELSKNARATWFGLIGLLVFVGVTLLGHKDADFFAFGAETQLPLVNVTIPVTAFFVFAPVLVAALYIYLHLYLMNLWDALADAPAKIEGQPLGDRVFPWLISHAALWYRNRRRGDGCTARRGLGRVVVAISLVLGFIFGIAVLALLWWRSMPAHDEGLTLWIGLCFWFATTVGWTGFRTARARLAGVDREQATKTRWSHRLVSATLAVLLVSLSWLRTEGGFENYANWIERNGEWIGAPEASALLNANLPGTKEIEARTDLRWFRLYPAVLVEAELTRKPPGWLPWHLWREDFEEKYRRRKAIAPGPELTNEQKPAFETEAKERYAEYIAQLAAPDLQRADLRNANLFGAFLPGANLRWAQMQGADLGEAQMQGADLFGAEMQGANLSRAKMQGAYLGGALMQGAYIAEAGMQGANLDGAQMQGANLFGAEIQGAGLHGALMQGANLGGALMQGANLGGALMQGADLGAAQMQGAYLGAAQMQGANLSAARMQGAYLGRAKMQGADLGAAQMQDADCSWADLRGAQLQSAILTCKENTLTQAQLDQAVGDPETVLPDGLTVASCLATLPPDVEAALAHHPEESGFFRSSRTEIRDALLCDKGENPVRFD